MHVSMKKKTSTEKKPPRDKLPAVLKKVARLEKTVQSLNAMIKEKKAAEASLEKERNLLRTLIDNMPDYIYIKDKESRFVMNNKAHLGVLGAKTQSDVAGKTDLDIFPADMAARYYSDEQIVLQLGRPVVNREEPFNTRDGTEKWLSTTKIAVRDPDGRISGLVGMSRDITERKNFEKALQTAKDELENRVAERTLDLKNVNELLAEGLSQLHFLNRTSYKLSQLLQVAELGPEIIKAFTHRFPQAEAALFIRNQGSLEIVGSTKVFSDPRFELSARTALGFLKEEGLQKTMIIKDWPQNAQFSALDWPEMTNLSCYVTIPLCAENKCIAMMQIFTTAAFCSDFEAELPVLNTLAAHAAACLSNALNYQQLDKSARQQGELSAARTIQQRFSLFHTPSVPHLKFKSVYLPAYEVGGDYLDCFETHKGDWVIVIADVCGKGMPAALFMIMLRSAFRMLGHSANSARDLLCAVNEEMGGNLSEMIFVTALCLVIKKDGTSMTCARAGHPGMLWQTNQGENPRLVKSRGLAMGLVSDPVEFRNSLEETHLLLVPGNRFLIYTDGLTEAVDPDMKLFGLERVIDLLTNSVNSNPDTLIKKILDNVNAFQKDKQASDDLTILAMDVE